MDTILGIVMLGIGAYGLGALSVLLLTHGPTVWWEDDEEPTQVRRVTTTTARYGPGSPPAKVDVEVSLTRAADDPRRYGGTE